jgi:hypothetical protein
MSIEPIVNDAAGSSGEASHATDLLAPAVDAAAAVLGLSLDERSRAAVIGYYRLAAGMAQTVMAVPLTAADESGSVFRPVCPPGSEDGA